MPIGWVKDAPAPVVEIVSAGADETTDEWVVGKFPASVPFALTVGGEGDAGVVDVDETTDASSVGKRDGAALVAGDGDGEAAAAAIGVGSALSCVEPTC